MWITKVIIFYMLYLIMNLIFQRKYRYASFYMVGFAFLPVALYFKPKIFQLGYFFIISILIGVFYFFYLKKSVKKEGLKIFPSLLLVSYKSIFLFAIGVSFSEETFFRGILINIFPHQQLYHFLDLENIYVSIIFSLTHILNIFSKVENLRYFLITFPLRFGASLMLGLIYKESGLFASFLVHFLFDFISLHFIYEIQRRRLDDHM